MESYGGEGRVSVRIVWMDYGEERKYKGGVVQVNCWREDYWLFFSADLLTAILALRLFSRYMRGRSRKISVEITA